MTHLQDTIVEKIRSGQVDMRPKWHFVLKTALLCAAILIVAMVAVYLLSFVFFALASSGVWRAPFFGWAGVMLLVISSPWLLILLVGLFLLILYALVTHFSFSYRKPLVYSLVGSVLFVVGVSSFIQYTMVHERMKPFVERHHVPGFAPLYEGVDGRRPEGMVVGTIETVNDASFTLRTDTGELITVILSAKMKQSKNAVYVPGGQVMIFGKLEGNEINAFGVRILNDTLSPELENTHQEKQQFRAPRF